MNTYFKNGMTQLDIAKKLSLKRTTVGYWTRKMRLSPEMKVEDAMAVLDLIKYQRNKGIPLKSAIRKVKALDPTLTHNAKIKIVSSEEDSKHFKMIKDSLVTKVSKNMAEGISNYILDIRSLLLKIEDCAKESYKAGYSNGKADAINKIRENLLSDTD